VIDRHNMIDPLPEPAAAPSTDPRLAYQWLLEVWLTRIRRAGVPLALALPLLFSTVASTAAVALAAGIALANGGLAGLLGRGPCPRRLRAARGLATGLDWGIALAVIALRARDPDNDALLTLLLLIVLAGARHRLRGALAAAFAGIIVTGTWLSLQAFALRRLDAATAGRDLGEWALAIGLTALLVGGQVRAGGEWFARQSAERECERHEAAARYREECARRTIEEAEFQRRQMKLTRREWEVLGLVAEGLDDAQIGAALSISPSTAKAHVYHISEKLGVTGRRAVAELARQRGVVQVQQRFRSQADQTVVVRHLGGTIANCTLTNASEPELAVGQRVLLFLAAPVNDGAGRSFQVLGGHQGQWAVGADDTVANRAEHLRGLNGLTVGQVEGRVRAALVGPPPRDIPATLLVPLSEAPLP